MGGATTRRQVRRMYEACKTCPKNCSGFGVCSEGYENFYARVSKKPACPKAAAEHARFLRERSLSALGRK